MKVKFTTPGAQLYSITATLLIGCALSNAHAAAPPPPTEPPTPLLLSIEIVGQSALFEGDSEPYVCTATYSDRSSKTVAAEWSVDSAVAAINSSGVLTAASVAFDQAATITAAFNGRTATFDVTIRDIPVVLTGVTISGPGTINEETSAQYLCTASYSDGSTQSVTPLWSENIAAATVSTSGLLVAGNISANQTLTLTANFGGFSDTHAVSIKYVPPVLTGLMIIGADTLAEETVTSYICMASFSDGTHLAVSPNWSVNSGVASISATGILSAGNIAADQSVVLTASYGGRTDTHALLINYVAPALMGITISGPTVVDEESTTQFICTAAYSDGTTAPVFPLWDVDSAFASINSTGELVADDVIEDTELTLSASFEGKAGEHSLTVRVAATQVIYPLSAFEGKTVRADLWDAVNEQLMPLGELDSPDELIIENLNPGQWYWLTIQELNTSTGDWVPMQENWINM